jgi:hypothetical protein
VVIIAVSDFGKKADGRHSQRAPVELETGDTAAPPASAHIRSTVEPK